MMSFPAWRCARTSARICWTRVAIVAAKAGSTQYVIPSTVASGVLGGLHSAATSVPAQRNSAASVSAGRSTLIGLPPLRPRGDERRAVGGKPMSRSEEHTSELQSLTNLVCRLLLEKKKKIEHPPSRV